MIELRQALDAANRAKEALAKAEGESDQQQIEISLQIAMVQALLSIAYSLYSLNLKR